MHFSVTRNQDNPQADPQPRVDQDGVAFKKLLSTIAEKLGSSNVPELQLFLFNLKCPDGSPFIRSKHLYRHSSVNDIFMSLVAANLCTPWDLDVLIHILCGLKRHDLLSFISSYIPHVTVGKPVGELVSTDENVLLKIELHSALKTVDLGIISAIKHEICTCCLIPNQPHLMQYVGWKSIPVTLFFQVPNSCMLLVESGLQNSTLHELGGSGINCVTFCFNKTTVCYSIPCDN